LAQAWRAHTYWGEELELTEFPRFLRTPNVKTRDLQIVVMFVKARPPVAMGRPLRRLAKAFITTVVPRPTTVLLKGLGAKKLSAPDLSGVLIFATLPYTAAGMVVTICPHVEMVRLSCQQSNSFFPIAVPVEPTRHSALVWFRTLIAAPGILAAV